ncbi:MAG: hypothetical protein QW482_02125 [Thermoproteota archaeon]
MVHFMGWYGLYPPQAIFSKRRFRRVILDPPNFNPGSWCGAGKMWIDEDNGEYWLTSRPREMREMRRGYAVEIYRSRDGENYDIVTWITKEELSEMTKTQILSIENQQLLKDPLTGRYHLYLSLNVSRENLVVEGKAFTESRWETFLLTSEDPSGSWEPEGFVIRGSEDYDGGEARDATIDIVDGRYFCLYKARKAGTAIVKTALAVSTDGKSWIKLGVPTVDGKSQPDFFLLSGSIIPGSTGLVFIGTKTLDVIRGNALTKHFVAYSMDLARLNLETVFEKIWTPLSRFEHVEYPIHTYAQAVFDRIRGDRWLIWVEAVDPTHTRELGWSTQVDRLVLYTSEMKKKGV